MFQPPSDNIIFFDAEFTSLNPYEGELLSVGLVKFTGEECYIELEPKGQASAWTARHVVPLLTEAKVSRADAVVRIKEFVGAGRPYMMAYVNQFDALFLYKLLTEQEGSLEWTSAESGPFHWIPLDFASILFAVGRNPEHYNRRDKKSICQELGIDTAPYREHHALDDARLLREVYRRLLRRAATAHACASGGACGRCENDDTI